MVVTTAHLVLRPKTRVNREHSSINGDEDEEDAYYSLDDDPKGVKEKAGREIERRRVLEAVGLVVSPLADGVDKAPRLRPYVPSGRHGRHVLFRSLRDESDVPRLQPLDVDWRMSRQGRFRRSIFQIPIRPRTCSSEPLTPLILIVMVELSCQSSEHWKCSPAKERNPASAMQLHACSWFLIVARAWSGL